MISCNASLAHALMIGLFASTFNCCKYGLIIVWVLQVNRKNYLELDRII